MSDTRLKSLIERIERLIEERQGIAGDIRDIFTEAKSAGYVPKAMRKVIARRAMNAADLAEEDALIEAYEAAAGAAGVAAKLVAGGATIDEAAAKTGVPRSTVGFLKASGKSNNSRNLDERETREVQPAGTASGDGGCNDRPAPPPANSSNASPRACVDGASESSPEGNNVVPRFTTTQTATPARETVTPAPEGGLKGLAPSDDLAIPPFLKRVSPGATP